MLGLLAEPVICASERELEELEERGRGWEELGEPVTSQGWGRPKHIQDTEHPVLMEVVGSLGCRTPFHPLCSVGKSTTLVSVPGRAASKSIPKRS